ncbi:MAG: TetR/AcrR family transcriptional regulator [Planctomycetota bacterium]
MPRGRPPQFDESKVLDTAATLFKRDGYDAVSVAELCSATGLAVQSLYHRFGDKAGLYREALQRYGCTANDPIIAELESAEDPLAAVAAFVRRWKRHAGASRDDGCLFTQALAQGDRSDAQAPDAVARAFTARLRRALTATLRRAADQKQLSADVDPAGLADTLLTLAFGVAVVGRGGMPGPMIDHAVASALALLRGYRGNDLSNGS